MKKGYTKYKKEILEEIVKNSVNYLQVIRSLGLSESGGSQQHIKKIIISFGIDTSHFLGYKTTAGLRNSNLIKITRTSDDILSKGKTASTTQLKRALKENNVEYKCSSCGLIEWLGLPISIQIHHKDGDKYNNQISNLCYLCPNCHSQTDNWGQKKRII
jgi:Zn finger protein HypA/HybF involved in hydrogenase expression